MNNQPPIQEFTLWSGTLRFSRSRITQHVLRAGSSLCQLFLVSTRLTPIGRHKCGRIHDIHFTLCLIMFLVERNDVPVVTSASFLKMCPNIRFLNATLLRATNQCAIPMTTLDSPLAASERSASVTDVLIKVANGWPASDGETFFSTGVFAWLL